MSTSEFLAAHEAAILRLLDAEFGLVGALEPLPGEQDRNLRLRSADGDHLVKIPAEDVEHDVLALQTAALEHVAARGGAPVVPRVVRPRSGDAWATLSTDDGAAPVWVTTWLDGALLAEHPDVDAALCERVGRELGRLANALADFADPRAERALKWDLRRAGWIAEHVDALAGDPPLHAAVRDVVARLPRLITALDGLPQAVLHNDANDYNLLVTAGDAPTVSGVIDFGDMCRTSRVCEVAIAASYLAMHTAPLEAIDAAARGFDEEHRLLDEELDLIAPLVEARLAVSAVNAALRRRERPDDGYVSVSQAGARRVLLHLAGRDDEVAAVRVRRACGRDAAAPARVAAALRAARGSFAPVLDLPGTLDEALVLDLSFASTTAGDDPTRFDAGEAGRRIAARLREASTTVAIGRYAEPRPLYTDDAFADAGDPRPIAERRTVHLGVDLFAPAGTRVTAPLTGTVHAARTCDGHLDYGGLVVLRHELDGEVFGTLYGHLDPESTAGLRVGDEVAAGQAFAALGDERSNGGWPPHLHVQVLATDPSRLPDVPRGVAAPDDVAAHRIVYPDPQDLLDLDERATWRDGDRDRALADERAASFAQNLATSYRRPLALVRGHRHFVFDRDGRRHLDAYNNVPHVGHCHPRVVRAIQEQTALLTTNTRYLHDGMHRYAAKLRALLPDELSVLLFTPSGSEANELALRLAQKHTGRRDVCVMDHGYHGHTNAAMAMSPYKFRQAGAPPKPDWVHVTVQPDTYRGAHAGEGAGARYAAEVAATIDALERDGRAPCAYLCECLPSVGGQLELPDGFLAAVYARVRTAGGVCIADDVQTALWRTGDRAFGFERHGVVPDVLVLGKPLGNGFPLAAVATTRAIADSFADGPEFFSTFGGSTVAMAAGEAVLDVLADEGLAHNARRVGAQLLDGLRSLQARFASIGDVRGRGFFLGVELVRDRDSKEPATALASDVKNRLRARRVLIGTDGPMDNVLKIRPPMTFDEPAADCLLVEIERALAAARA